MPKLSPLCLAALLVLQLPPAAVHAQEVSSQAETALAARIDAVVAPHYPSAGPGASVIVVKDGKTVLRKAYGMADTAARTSMTPDTSLRLGSITKQFTSTAILMLADERKLAVSDPITRFFPDYPTGGKTITVEHLLTHTSGIVSYTGKLDYREKSGRDLTVAQMIDSFKNDPLEFEPGTRYAYNNSGYFLLGAIIEKLSGMPYAKFIEQRIFVPLGMENSAYEGFERGKAPRAAGHSLSPKGLVHAAALSMTQPYAAGSLVSTVDDLARWDAAVSAGKLLKSATWKQAFTPYRLADGKSIDYGYGWHVEKLRGAQEIGHGGGINGFSTYALRVPEHKLYVALLTNADSGFIAPTVVAKRAAAVALGNPYPEFKAVALSAPTLDGYAGAYKLDDRMTRMVSRNGDHLLVQRSGRAPQALYPLGADRFFMKDMLTVYRFERDARGAVEKLVLDDDGIEQLHVRTGDVPARKAIALAPGQLDAFTGRFQVTPAFLVDLTREGDKLFAQATGQRKFHLVPVGENAFYVKEIDAEVVFEDDNEEIVLLQGGRRTSAFRVK